MKVTQILTFVMSCPILGGNKAGYTAISRVLLGGGSNAQKSKKTLYLRKRDRRTNGPTDGPTDGHTLL